MANDRKSETLAQLRTRFGKPKKLPRSQSLYEFGDGALRLYFRYSKVHGSKQTFYGLRKEDLRQLEGFPSYVCFIWDEQSEPLFVPFADYEEVFRAVWPAPDGHFKVQIYLEEESTQLYVARGGRFNVDSYFGWRGIEQCVDMARSEPVPDLSHAQVQTLLGSIGASKNYDIWIPVSDRGFLDSDFARVTCCGGLPTEFDTVRQVLEEIVCKILAPC